MNAILYSLAAFAGWAFTGVGLVGIAVAFLSPVIALVVLLQCGVLEALATIIIAGPAAGMIGVILWAVGQGILVEVES